MKRYSAMLMLASLMLPSLAMAQDVCAQFGTDGLESIQDGLWSDPATWGGRIPGAADNVIVSSRVVADVANAAQIKISGSLELAGQIDTWGSIVVCPSGSLSGAEGVINFHVEDDRAFTSNTVPGPIPGYSGFHPDDTGLWVFGTLNLTAPEVTSWIDAESINVFEDYAHGVDRSVSITDSSATLSTTPAGWQAGDELILADTSGEHARARLRSVAGRQITFDLLDSQTGFNGFVLRANGEQIRPKVGNLSRRLQIVSADVVEGDFNHRAHTAYMGNAEVNIQNVEFRNLGPRAKLGRYPVHWHFVNDTGGLISGSSVWQDVSDPGNRFITIHHTQNVVADNNIGFLSQGHGMFMEDQYEWDNTVSNNLTVDVRFPEEIETVDVDATSHTAHYWVRENNTIQGNVAVGHTWDEYPNTFPPIDGMIVLQSRQPGPAVVDEFESLGAGGFAIWPLVEDTAVNGLKAANSYISGVRSWDNTVVNDPLLLLNGNGGPYASGLYSNYGDFHLNGGTIAGSFGIHAHYGARFTVTGSTFLGFTMIAPTYWEVAGVVTDVDARTDNLLFVTYPNIKRNSPGIVRLNNVRWQGQSLNTAYTGPQHCQYFLVIGGGAPHGCEVEAPEQVEFIPRPAEVGGARFWSVVPAGDAPVIHYRIESENPDGVNNIYGGYLHGFPPGNYTVGWYADSSESSLVTEYAITIGVPGSGPGPAPDPEPEPDPNPGEEEIPFNIDDYLPQWADVDGDCINTRNEVLILESIIPVTMSADGCEVVAGLWSDPYSGEVLDDPADVHIDHAVPLYEAHQSGAAEWSFTEKQSFANDLLNRNVLVAVSEETAMSKGSEDPAQWLPLSSDNQCDYVRNWIEVKTQYGLSFDSEETTAIETILGSSIDQHAAGLLHEGISLSGVNSDVLVSVEMTRNGGCSHYLEGSTLDLLDISVSVIPGQSQIDNPFDLFIIASLESEFFVVLPSGELAPFNLDPDQLTPFVSDTFKESYSVPLFEGYLNEETDADLYVAIKSEGGELIYTLLPVRLTIRPGISVGDF